MALYIVSCGKQNLNVKNNYEYKDFHVVANSFGQAEERVQSRLNGFEITDITLQRNAEFIE